MPTDRAESTDLDVVVERDLHAPADLVWDVFTKRELVLQTIAPFGEQVVACDIDLRVGGAYHFAFVPDDGPECSFRGEYLEVDAPNRFVATWHFEGWPGVHAVEATDLRETSGVTRVRITLTFANAEDRAHMRGTDGYEGNFDQIELLLAKLQSS